MTTSTRDRLVGLLFMAALIVPGMLLAGGMRPENIEGRVLAPAPVVRLNRLLDPTLYAAVDRFLGDNFPLRTVAVTIRARLDYGLLHGSTNPDVVVGRGDWLFPADEFEPICRTDAAGLLASLDAVSARFAAAGRSLRFVIAPDKRSIYPEQVAPGPKYPNACTETQREAMQAGFGSRPDATTDLWEEVRAGKAQGGPSPIYWRTDTHWNDVGAMAGVRALIEDLAPGVWDENVVRISGASLRIGDLSRQIGLPVSEPAPHVVIERAGTLTRQELDPGVVVTPGRELLQYRFLGDDAVVPGRTLIVYDSSFGVHADLIAPWFAESTWLHVNELIEHPLIVDALPDYDRIIVERVERLAYTRDLAATLAPLLP